MRRADAWCVNRRADPRRVRTNAMLGTGWRSVISHTSMSMWKHHRAHGRGLPSVHPVRSFSHLLPPCQHPISFSVLIVCNATALVAANVCANLATPGVSRQTTLRRFNLNRTCLEVCPKGTVSSADRAVAACHSARRSPNMNANGTAVTGSDKHRVRGSCSA